jgi:hypothetical protein
VRRFRPRRWCRTAYLRRSRHRTLFPHRWRRRPHLTLYSLRPTIGSSHWRVIGTRDLTIHIRHRAFPTIRIVDSVGIASIVVHAIDAVRPILPRCLPFRRTRHRSLRMSDRRRHRVVRVLSPRAIIDRSRSAVRIRVVVPNRLGHLPIRRTRHTIVLPFIFSHDFTVRSRTARGFCLSGVHVFHAARRTRHFTRHAHRLRRRSH